VRIDVLTLFPPMVDAPLSLSIVGRARAAGTLALAVHDIRAHGIGRHRVVDDTPYGGGSGMVMRVDVVAAAVAAVRGERSHVVLLDPGGRRFDQRVAEAFAALEHLVLVCGHYEGVDARVAAHVVDESVSLGEFVLTGGEPAAVCVVDAVARLVPGVLGNADSSREESFGSDGLLEYPQYTRPREWDGHEVPEILASGDHAKVAAWRREQAVARTLKS
jgi:tRNA (guanine37-N1)-methyltransferase